MGIASLNPSYGEPAGHAVGAHDEKRYHSRCVGVRDGDERSDA